MLFKPTVCFSFNPSAHRPSTFTTCSLRSTTEDRPYPLMRRHVLQNNNGLRVNKQRSSQGSKPPTPVSNLHWTTCSQNTITTSTVDGSEGWI